MENLPELPLMRIAAYLSPEEITRLSLTCKRFYGILPRFLLIRGPDFHLNGPDGGHRAPEYYFDGPVLKTKVKSLKSSVLWKDQGYLNRKGRIFVKLMRPINRGFNWSLRRKPKVEEEIARNENMFGIAEHVWKTSSCLLVDDAVVKLAQPGDFYRFMKEAGGGGGHELFVKNFTVLLELL